MDRLQYELQKESQLERLMLFTDAVFAIAITLLALELRPPAVEAGTTDALIAGGLLALLPKLMGFLISFFLIGFYWTVHHRLCGQLIDYDQKLLWLNLLFLLTIVLMPFSTALYSEAYQPNVVVPLAVYTANIWLTVGTSWLLARHVGNPAAGLSLPRPPEPAACLALGLRTAMMPVLFGVGLLVAVLLPPAWRWVGRMAPALIPLYRRATRRWANAPATALPVEASVEPAIEAT